MGLANDAVPDPELDSLVDEVGQRLAAFSPAALGLAKKAFSAFDAHQFDERLRQAEAVYLDELMLTEDAVEGVNAFLQKRKPLWKGKIILRALGCRFSALGRQPTVRQLSLGRVPP